MLGEARPQLIDGMPHSLELLAHWMVENGRSYERARLVSFAGGRRGPGSRELFKQAFGHCGVEYYSTTECGIIGSECPYCGLSTFNDNTRIVEVVDDQDRPVRDGETGRAIITCLDQFATPIIRYDIGDYITLPADQHSCRRGFSHYSCVEGRVTDRITLPNGRTIHHQHLYPIIRREAQNIKQYQLWQGANGDLVFKYVPKPGVDASQLGRNICNALSDSLDSPVRAGQCELIPLEASGKMKPMKTEKGSPQRTSPVELRESNRKS